MDERLRRELPDASFTFTARVVAGEVALLEWTASAPSGARVEDGADSFAMRGGAIVAQTIHYTVLPPLGSPQRATTAPRPTEVLSMAENVTLQVEGMTCTGCEQRLGKALGRLDGVREATADHRTGRVRVRFDPAVIDRAALAAQVHTAGYEVTGDAGDGTGEPRR